jgi:hypothetical protein
MLTQHNESWMISWTRTKELTRAFSSLFRFLYSSACAHNQPLITAGINYTYQGGELHGCHGDALKMRQYALRSGYADENIIVLLDRDGFMHPTAKNMRDGFQ